MRPLGRYPPCIPLQEQSHQRVGRDPEYTEDHVLCDITRIVTLAHRITLNADILVSGCMWSRHARNTI